MSSLRCLVVMGVTGSGKSTLAEALAQALGWRFVEGDSLHPPANIAKMAAGEALSDDDRAPFLDNVAAAIAAPGNAVVSCSALKRRYRDRLRRADPQLVFVLPQLSRSQLLERLQQRRGHFMPASLLDSQLETLQLPGPDERCILTAGCEPLDQQIAAVLTGVGRWYQSRRSPWGQ